jgi:hypothetical protein
MNMIGVKDETVTEYLWDRTPSVVMPILLHGGLPDGFRISAPYYKAVVAVLDQFDVPTAGFHPYWRNGDLLQWDNKDFKVTAYSRPKAPRLLLVVGNLSKEDGEVTIKVNLKHLYDWKILKPAGMPRVIKPGELMQVVERMGARDARILEIGPHHIKLHVKGHSMALVEASGHIRIQ